MVCLLPLLFETIAAAVVVSVVVAVVVAVLLALDVEKPKRSNVVDFVSDATFPTTVCAVEEDVHSNPIIERLCPLCWAYSMGMKLSVV